MDKDEIIDFIIRYNKYFFIAIVLLLQIWTIAKLDNVEKTWRKIDGKLAEIQTIIGISEAPDTGKAVLKSGTMRPVEKTKALLPIKPDNEQDIAYIEAGYSKTENYYPTETPLVYYVSDSINEAGANYSKKLMNAGWQILNVRKGGQAGTDYMKSFSASNGNGVFDVEILERFGSYVKKADGGSFVQITLKK